MFQFNKSVNQERRKPGIQDRGDKYRRAKITKKLQVVVKGDCQKTFVHQAERQPHRLKQSENIWLLSRLTKSDASEHLGRFRQLVPTLEVNDSNYEKLSNQQTKIRPLLIPEKVSYMKRKSNHSVLKTSAVNTVIGIII